jgi:hypothetical protein
MCRITTACSDLDHHKVHAPDRHASMRSVSVRPTFGTESLMRDVGRLESICSRPLRRRLRPKLYICRLSAWRSKDQPQRKLRLFSP